MSLNQYLSLMLFGSSLGWLGWFLTMWLVDPFEASTLEKSFFYISLFLALVGSFSVIGLLVRRYIVKRDELIFRHVKNAFRQSVFIAVIIIFTLILQSLNLLTWWNAPILVVLVVLIELSLFSKRRFLA